MRVQNLDEKKGDEVVFVVAAAAVMASSKREVVFRHQRTQVWPDRFAAVQVHVMDWDEKYAGWVPLEDDSLAEIVIKQRVHYDRSTTIATRCFNSGSSQSSCGGGNVNAGQPNASIPCHVSPRYEYILHGESLRDHKVLFSVELSREANFKQIMPTLQFWQIGESKLALKFLNSPDAVRFRSRIMKAIEHLCRQSKSSSGESILDIEELDDDVFMPIDLPLNHNKMSEVPCHYATTLNCCPQTSSAPSSCDRVKFLLPPRSAIHRLNSYSHNMKTLLSKLVHPRSKSTSKDATICTATSADVVFDYRKHHAVEALHSQPDSASGQCHGRSFANTRPQSLPQPKLFSMKNSMAQMNHKPSCSSVVKTPGGLQPLLLTQHRTKSSQNSLHEFVRREQCSYCRNFYSVDQNHRGACPCAPDRLDTFIRNDNEAACCFCCMCDKEEVHLFRLTLLTVLSLIMPCLWCYLPLRACHKCYRCHASHGGTASKSRHKPIIAESHVEKPTAAGRRGAASDSCL
ncbi:unnamed protein product [Soboliphyme baturini]|uniref:Sprouty-related, EVH1 domain-containing protein 2 n=1 Tax=Soboliphyme baturini TaxID=241478 RepID=A0A183I8R9_9BILA|nr:unnamed protein product [Soboliphyme baturini]